MKDIRLIRALIGQAHEHILKAQAFIAPLIRMLNVEETEMDWHYEPALKEPVETDAYTAIVNGKYVSSRLLPPKVLEKVKAVIPELNSTFARFDAFLLGDSEDGTVGISIDEFTFTWDSRFPPLSKKIYVQCRGHYVGQLVLIEEENDQ